MKKTLFILLLFIVALLAFPATNRPVHAQLTGVVCIDPAIAQNVAPTGCSSPPVQLGGTQFIVGSKITLEVDLAGSDITNGFDVAVVTDPAILNPLSVNTTGTATLINAIGGSPFPLINCVNNGVGGSAVSCVTGIDGPGVAHLSVVALGGLSIAPTTGRLMYINYQVMNTSSNSPINYVVTPPGGACAGSSNSSPSGDTCVFIANGGGGFDPENVQTATFSNQALFDNTSTAVACSPSTILPGATSTCTATVTDTTTPANIPTGTVSFTSSNAAVGTVGTSCTLGASGTCAVTFTGVAPGTATVTGSYVPDATHNGSSGTSNTITVVLPSKDTTSTSVTCPGTVVAGQSITCTVNVTDLNITSNTPTGSVSFTSSNTGVGTVGASCTLSAGSCTVSFTGVAPGNATITGTYVGDSSHFGSIGTSGPITVTIPPPVFVHGKLSWTHHLSISKASGLQTFTAHVEDMATVPVFVQVVVTGVSDNGQPFSATSAITMLQPGMVTDITFAGSVPSGSVGFKISFTATLPWGLTSALGQPSASSKSGTFAVVS